MIPLAHVLLYIKYNFVFGQRQFISQTVHIGLWLCIFYPNFSKNKNPYIKQKEHLDLVYICITQALVNEWMTTTTIANTHYHHHTTPPPPSPPWHRWWWRGGRSMLLWSQGKFWHCDNRPRNTKHLIYSNIEYKCGIGMVHIVYVKANSVWV